MGGDGFGWLRERRAGEGDDCMAVAPSDDSKPRMDRGPIAQRPHLAM